MRKVIIFACLMAILLVPIVAAAVEKAPRITDREIVERLTRLEEGQKALNKRFDDVNRRIDDVNRRIDDLRAEMNGRIDDLRAEMNGRFQAMDKRFDTLQWMFGFFITISLVILGFVLRMQWSQRSPVKGFLSVWVRVGRASVASGWLIIFLN